MRYFKNNKYIHAKINQEEREQEKRNMLKVDAQQRGKHSTLWFNIVTNQALSY